MWNFFELIEWIMFMNHLSVIQTELVSPTVKRAYVCLRFKSSKEDLLLSSGVCVGVIKMIEKRYIWEQKTNTQLQMRKRNSQLSMEIRWRYLHSTSHSKRFMNYFIFFTWLFSSFWKGISYYRMFSFLLVLVLLAWNREQWVASK